MKGPTPGGVSSVRKAIDLLFAFSRHDTQLSLSELARRTGLEPTTAHRLVTTLLEAGLLRQVRMRGEYRLGSRLLELGFSVLDAIEVRRVAFPYLVAFHSRTHTASSSSLLVPDGLEMLNVERLPPRQCVLPPGTSRLGYRFQMAASAAGKMYLALLPADERRALVGRNPITRWTDGAAIDINELEAELEETRRRGFGISDQEAVPGSRAIAVPIRDGAGRPVGALLAQASTIDLTLEEMIEGILPALTMSAAQISAVLGYRGPNADQYRAPQTVSARR